MDHSELRGRLLVAAPSLTDPNFRLAVVLLLDHTDEGAVGVLLNRPSDMPLASALPQWEPLATSPDAVFLGGPVQRDAIVALGRTPTASDSPLQRILAGTAVVDLQIDPDQQPADLQSVRLFAGYAGWGAGQLEAEIDAGGWFVVEAEAADVFTDEPAQLWDRVLARQGGIFRTLPPDPTLN